MPTGEETYSCGRPPQGWTCSREPNHEGPCAASMVVDPRQKHIDCDSYTEYKPMFGLFKEQSELIAKWKKEHDAEKHIPAGATHRYSGAIDGAYTYSFTSTSLGTVVSVRCSCGEAIDVSDYNDW